MDRSLRWRFLALAAIVVYCAGVLAPTLAPKNTLPSWFPFSKKISLGLDLQGGIHIEKVNEPFLFRAMAAVRRKMAAA